jgi:hypothetical protein
MFLYWPMGSCDIFLVARFDIFFVSFLALVNCNGNRGWNCWVADKTRKSRSDGGFRCCHHHRPDAHHRRSPDRKISSATRHHGRAFDLIGASIPITLDQTPANPPKAANALHDRVHVPPQT